MLDKLTVSDFEGQVEAPFPVALPGEGAVELRLIEAKGLGEAVAGAGRRPFSLIFLGPDRPTLDQRVHPVEHPALGRLEIFLVPIGPERGRSGLRYQAIFA